MPDISLLPDYDVYSLIISFSLCSLLGIYVYFKGVLDALASVIAVVLGFLLIGYTDLFWFLLMLLFLVICYWVTIWKYKNKSENGSGEGTKGERGVRNVLANGVIPLMVAIFWTPLDNIAEGLSGFLFIAALSIATADTFASEIGIMAKRPRLITDPRKIVEPGVDGGVSLLGNISALVGSMIISIGGYFLITDRLLAEGPHLLNAAPVFVVVTIIIGVVGCQIDSVLGATLQRRNLISNDMVNFVTIAFGVMISAPLYLLLS